MHRLEWTPFFLCVDEGFGCAWYRILEIFAVHDEEAAVALTLEHWELSRTNIESYIRPTPLSVDIDLAV